MPDLDTRQTLLMRIRDADDQHAWEEFVELYAPVIYRFTLSRGLGREDAGDVVQDVMRSVSGAMEDFEYDSKRGKFRSWLFTVVRNQIAGFYRRKACRPQLHGGTTVLAVAEGQEVCSESEPEWEREYQHQLFHWAAAKVRQEFGQETWQAFWRTAVEDHDAADVARDLEMSRSSVYVAKSRAVKRIKEVIHSAAGENWEQEMIDRESL